MHYRTRFTERCRNALTALALAGGVAALAGCPGSLDDPGRFAGATGAGGSVPTSTAAGASCDTIQGTVIPSQTCVKSSCHSSDGTQYIDLTPGPDLKDRILDKKGTSPGCGNYFLVDSQNPEKSLIYAKLLDPPICGARMPFVEDQLPEADRECILQWVTALGSGAAGSGGSSGGTGGAPAGSGGAPGTGGGGGAGGI